jgi:predicted ATPase
MKIKEITVKDLSNRITGTFHLHDDINVITGLNGSGKTTLLKAAWYLISGNAERVDREVQYNEIQIATDIFRVTLAREEGTTKWRFESSSCIHEGEQDSAEEPRPNSSIEELNRHIIETDTTSLFFPTFRRIEGGYSMSPPRRRRRMVPSSMYFLEEPHPEAIQHELEQLSSRISVNEHNFICSISTNDIVSLLTRKYAAISESLNQEYKEFSTSIIDSINRAQEDSRVNEIGSKSDATLEQIQQQVDSINKLRDDLLKPFTVLSELTARLFRHRGIKVNAVTLGQSVDAIDSGVLSAGEKQMLSFLCYNAFRDESIIFIDEPELSLHPDWQRRIFSVLMRQQPTNQFIVATHSPFIYTKYEDKEIMLSEDKGA